MAGIKGKYFRISSAMIHTNPSSHLNRLYFHVLARISVRRSALIGLAFAGSIGMTLVILACALPQYGLWWPFFVVLFYVLAPIPTLVARRYTIHQETSNAILENAIFVTMGVVVSSFALPIVLARVGTVEWGACNLTLAGNVIVYLTLIGFFVSFDQEDDYNMW